MKTPINTPEQWNELRSKNIGGSEIAGLFGVSKYHTPFKLYHVKKGGIAEDVFGEDGRAELGKCLESGIAEFLSKKFDLIIRKASAYVTHDTLPGMGCSLDYEVYVYQQSGDAVHQSDFTLEKAEAKTIDLELDAAEKMWVPFEIKHIDFLVFRDEWLHTVENEPEPSYDIAMQVQQQIDCCNAPGAYLGVLVGTSSYLIKQPRHDKAITAIREKVSQFWDDVKNNREPALNQGDLETLKRLYPEITNAKEVIDLGDDKKILDICESLMFWKKASKESETNLKLLQQELLYVMQANKKAVAGKYEITAGERRIKEKFVEAYIKPARIDRLSPVVKIADEADEKEEA